MLSTIGLGLFVVSSGAIISREPVAFSPAVIGGADVNVITGPEIFPRVTQSETSTWGHGNTVHFVCSEP